MTHIHGNQSNESNQIGQQFQNKGSGAMSIGAAQVGDNSEANVSGVGSIHQQGLSAADMLALAEALRADAATLDEAASKTVTKLAQEIEEAVQADDRKGFGALFEKAVQYASLLGNNLEQVTRIIEAFQQ